MGRWDLLDAPFSSAESDQPLSKRDYVQEEARRREQAARADVAQYDIEHQQELTSPFETPLSALSKATDPLGNIAMKGSEMALRGTKFAAAAPFIGLAAGILTPGPGEFGVLGRGEKAFTAAEEAVPLLSQKMGKIKKAMGKAETFAEKKALSERLERLGGISTKLRTTEITGGPQEIQKLLPYYPSPTGEAKAITATPKLLGRSPDVIREAGGLPGVSPSVATDISNRLVKLRQDTADYTNEALKSQQSWEKAFDKLPLDQQKVVADAVENRSVLSEPHLNDIVQTALNHRFGMRDVALGVGIPVPGKTSFPHINPNVSEILRLGDSDMEKARAFVTKLFAEDRPNMPQPSIEEVDGIINRLKSGYQSIPRREGRMTAYVPNLVFERGEELPGWLGDVNSPRWTPQAWKEGWNAYNLQWGFGRAYAEQFGAGGEKLEELLKKTNNDTFKDYVRRSVENIVGGEMGGVLDSRSKQLYRTFRSIQSAAILDKTFIQSFLEPLLKGPAASSQGIGLARGMTSFLKSMASGIVAHGDARRAARTMGTLGEETTRGILEMEKTAGGIPSLASRLESGAETVQNISLAPLRLSNEVTDTFDTAIARTSFKDLYDTIQEGGGTIFKGKLAGAKLGPFTVTPNPALNAESEIRRLLGRADQIMAERLIYAAKRGEPLTDGAGKILPEWETAERRFVFEAAREMQPVADAYTVPTFIKNNWVLSSVYRWKNWSTEFGRYVWQRGVVPALRGNPGPLIALTAGMQLTGASQRFVYDLIAGKIKSDDDIKERYGLTPRSLASNFAWAGGLAQISLAYNVANDLASGIPVKIARGVSRALGPDVGAVAEPLISAGSGPFSTPGDIAAGFAERYVPGADPFIARMRQQAREKKAAAKGPQGPKRLKPKGWMDRPITDLLGRMSFGVPAPAPAESLATTPVPAAAGSGRWDDL